MRFYIASRWERKDEVRAIYEKVCTIGHTITHDWTNDKVIKPYDKEPAVSERYSLEDITGATNADVFVLLSDEKGTGMYIEFGAALRNAELNGLPQVYVIGDNLARSMFFFHPNVKRRNSIEEVLDDFK